MEPIDWAFIGFNYVLMLILIIRHYHEQAKSESYEYFRNEYINSFPPVGMEWKEWNDAWDLLDAKWIMFLEGGRFE